MDQKVSIAPFYYAGKLTAPSSKSYFQRALVISALANSPSDIYHNGWSNDTVAVKQVIQQHGAHVEETEGRLRVFPNQIANTSDHFNVGESGLALRMLASVLALRKTPSLLDGHGSLLQRPTAPVVEFLHHVGVEASCESGSLPIRISSQLKGGAHSVDGSFSSQLLTGLLIAAPLLAADSHIRVHDLKSKPYIDMTLQVMEHFDVYASHNEYRDFYIDGNQTYTGKTYTVEGDWSGAANHIVGAAVSGEIKISALNRHSAQADRAIMKAVGLVGAHVSWDGDELVIKKKDLHPYSFDATHCPDLFPPLVALACACKGRSALSGIHRLQHKESDRLSALVEQFTALGACLSIDDDTLMIEGTGSLLGGEVKGYNDHRMVMSAAIASTIAKGPVSVTDTNAVDKSYPTFFDDLDCIRNSRM